MRLQGCGLVEARRGAGSFVRQRPPEHQIHHLLSAQARTRAETFELRLAIEPIAARMAALHRTSADLQAIKAAAADLFAALTAGGAASDYDLRLYRSIAIASHNSILPLTLERLAVGDEGAQDSTLAVAAGRDEDGARLLQFEYAAVVEAIEQCEPDTAEIAMRLHLMRARSRARRS